jgi:hypothetical protein
MFAAQGDALAQLTDDLERLVDLADGKASDWRQGRSAYAAVATEVMSMGRDIVQALQLALAYRQALEQLRAEPGRHPGGLPDPRDARAFLNWAGRPGARQH